MLNRIKALFAVGSPSLFERIALSVAVFGTIAIVVSTS